MTKEEELQALREENRTLKALVAELLPLKEQLAQANARIKDLEDRLAKDSRTSSKPPSSDGLTRLPRRSRCPSGKRPGGQAGHAWHTLSMVEQPDEVVRHRPEVCSQCSEDLSHVPGSVAERRQVLDLPEIRLLAQEHQIEAICCPTCHTTSLGSFPASVSAPVQYGPNLQALAVYLHQGQLLPTARTCQALASICGCQISEGTLLQWSELAAERLAPTVERIADLIVASQLHHADETGIRVYGMLHWLHVNCTRFLTHLAWHTSRGREAMDEIGIWPRFVGRGMHDRFASYDAYECAHSICGAHLLRDCAAVAQQEHQEWATEMQDFLLDLHDACQEWRLLHLTSVPAIERDEWVARYFEILAAGYAAQPPPPASSAGLRKGKGKQSQHLIWTPKQGVQIKCWLCSTTCGFLLRTTRPSGTFAWRKCSKRFLAPFAVLLGSPLFAAFAVIFRLCTSKDTPCSLLLLLSSMVNLYRSLGDMSSYLFL